MTESPLGSVAWIVPFPSTTETEAARSFGSVERWLADADASDSGARPRQENIHAFMMFDEKVQYWTKIVALSRLAVSGTKGRIRAKDRDSLLPTNRNETFELFM